MSVYTRALLAAGNAFTAARNYENPLVTKELRTRMRAGRAHWTMLVYVLVLGVVLFAVYYSEWMASAYSGGMHSWIQRRVGSHMFIALGWCQMGLLALIGPSLTSSSLTLEIEQQTFEMLSLTSLSPRNIIAGKAGAPCVFCWMLLACSLPLASLCLIFGGISPIEIVITYILLAVWAFLMCSAGVFWSSMVAKTSVASLLTYGTGMAYVLFTSLLAAPAFLIPGSGESLVFSLLNPGWATYRSLATTLVFKVPVPLSLVAFIVNVGLGLLMLTAAQTHLKYHRPDKALLVRAQLLGLSTFMMLMLFGNIASLMYGITGAGAGRELSMVILTIIMLVIYIFLPAFATGEVRSGESGVLRYVLSGFRFKKIFSRDLNGGLPFILLWLVISALTGIAALASAKSITAITEFNAAMVAVAAVAVAYYCFGVMVSSFAATRNLALILLFLFIIITFVTYPVLVSNYSFTDLQPKTRYELAYFWPALPLTTLESGFRNGAMGPRLAIDPHLHWLAVTVCYLAMAGIFLKTAAYCKGRCKGVSDE